MSIIETKFRKRFVETPELRTDNIKFLGQDYPLYDMVTSSFIPNPTEFETEIASAPSYANTLVNGIRMLTHTPVYHNSGLLMLTEITLFTHQRTGNNQVSSDEIVALCVYFRKDGEYIFIGNSSNPYANPNNAQEITFKFDDLKLYEVIGENEILPYSEVFIKPLRVRIDAFDPTNVGNTSWADNDNMSNFMLKGCTGSSFYFTPYVTSLDGAFSPHMIFKYKTGSFSVNDRIPHNMNGDVHLTPEEKRQVEAVCTMSNLIFDENPSDFVKTHVDSRRINDTYSRTNPETMCAIEIIPKSDYVGSKISELYIRRADGGNTDRYMNQKYLQADCFGENGQIITTKFSTNHNTQFNGDNNETGFQFKDFEILEEYKKIEFRLSASNTVRQDQIYLSFVGGSLRTSANGDAGKLLVRQGWILKWLNGAPAQGENPSPQNNMSPDFTIVLENENLIIGTGIVNHIGNNSIHVTDEQKEKLNSIDTLTTRISDIENSIGDNGSIAQDIEQLSDNIEQLSDNIDDHKSDNTKHITAQERTTWNNKLSSITAGEFVEVSNGNNISVKTSSALGDINDTVPTTSAVNFAINDVIDKFVNNYSNIYRYEQFSTLDNPKYHQDTAGKLTATGVKMSRRHFTSGDIRTIKFHAYDGVNVANVYLCVIVYAENEDDSTPKTLSDCIFSSNTQTTTTSSVGGVVFTFDNLVLPDNYKFVKLLFARNTETFPVSSDGNTVHGVKIQVLRNTEGNTWGEAENDECLVYQTGTNSSGEPNYQDWFPAITCSLLYRSENEVTSIMDRLEVLEYANNNPITPEDRELWNGHVESDDIHVTAEEKEKWNNIVIPEIPEPITYTAGDGIDIADNTISVITTDVIEESDKIPTAKALYNTFYGTRTFNNYDTSKYTQSADTVGTIVLSKKHFIKEGKITKVAIPHDKNIDNGEGGHLVIEVFAEDSSKSDGYDRANPIHRYYSDNYYAYKMNTQNGKYEWTFNNTECLIPSDYKVVHLSLVTDNTIVPSIGSSKNNRFRINCLAKNGNKNEGVVHEEDDECRVYWKAVNSDNPNIGGDNFVAIVQVEYIGNKLDDFSIVPMLLERIAALEARVNELENS